jgi:hypothetical protein
MSVGNRLHVSSLNRPAESKSRKWQQPLILLWLSRYYKSHPCRSPTGAVPCRHLANVQNMKCEHRIFSDSAVAIIRMRGELRAADLIRLKTDVWSDPAWNPDFDSIWECAGVPRLIFQPEDIPRLMGAAKRLSKQPGKGRRAVVVQKHIEYQIARLLSVRSNRLGRESKVFWRMPDAFEWLGLEMTDSIREYLGAGVESLILRRRFLQIRPLLRPVRRGVSARVNIH